MEEEKQMSMDDQYIVPFAEEMIEKVIRDQPYKSNKSPNFKKGFQKANKAFNSKGNQINKMAKNAKIEEKPAVAEPTMLDVNLEDILGSIPDRSFSSKPKKTAKNTKLKKTTKQRKLKAQAQKSTEGSRQRVKEMPSSELTKSALPQNDSEYGLIQSALKQPSQKQSSKPVSRKTSQSIEDLRIDELDQKLAFRLIFYQGSNTNSNIFEKSIANWINDVIYTKQEEIDSSLWFLLSSSAQLNDELSYVGKILDDPNSGTKLHLVPVENTTQSEVYHRFGNNLVFGIKQQRSYLSFKNKSSGQDIDFDGIVYNNTLTSNIILDTLDQDTFKKYVYNYYKKSYRYNIQLYLSNVNYWFAHFRILASVFKTTQLKFMSTILNRLFRTDQYYYSSPITGYIFSNFSNLSVMNLSPLLYTNPNFTDLVISSLKKDFNNNLIQSLTDFSSEGSVDFFDCLYNTPDISQYKFIKPQDSTAKTTKNKIKKRMKKKSKIVSINRTHKQSQIQK